MNPFTITCSMCLKVLLQGFANILDPKIKVRSLCTGCQERYELDGYVKDDKTELLFQVQELIKDL